MILKVRKKNSVGWGWIIKDNLDKVRYNPCVIHFSKSNPETVVIDTQQFKISDLEIFEVERTLINGISAEEILGMLNDDEETATFIVGTFGDRESFIVANTPMYLLNDNGKTIETL